MQNTKRDVIDSKTVSHDSPAPIAKAKKVYHSPVLEQFGDLETLTKGVGSGAGDAAGMSMVCWIAEALYGVDDHRTHLLRRWLNNVYSRTMTGAVIIAMYRTFGKRIAGWTRRSAVLRRVMSVPFDAGVAAALRHYTLTAR